MGPNAAPDGPVPDTSTAKPGSAVPESRSRSRVLIAQPPFSGTAEAEAMNNCARPPAWAEAGRAGSTAARQRRPRMRVRMTCSFLCAGSATGEDAARFDELMEVLQQRDADQDGRKADQDREDGGLGEHRG